MFLTYATNRTPKFVFEEKKRRISMFLQRLFSSTTDKL